MSPAEAVGASLACTVVSEPPPPPLPSPACSGFGILQPPGEPRNGFGGWQEEGEWGRAVPRGGRVAPAGLGTEAGLGVPAMGPRAGLCRGVSLRAGHALNGGGGPLAVPVWAGPTLGAGRVLATTEKPEKQGNKPSPKKSLVCSGAGPAASPGTSPRPGGVWLVGTSATARGLWVGDAAVPGAREPWHVPGGARAVPGCGQGAGGGRRGVRGRGCLARAGDGSPNAAVVGAMRGGLCCFWCSMCLAHSQSCQQQR